VVQIPDKEKKSGLAEVQGSVMTATCRAVLIHVVENILQVIPDDPLYQFTIGSGFDFTSDLLSLSDVDIASLTYTDMTTGSEKPLKVFNKNRIKILKV